jgi:hypothetical protein
MSDEDRVFKLWICDASVNKPLNGDGSVPEKYLKQKRCKIVWKVMPLIVCSVLGLKFEVLCCELSLISVNVSGNSMILTQ